MKSVRITLAGTGRVDLHDGIGGVHLDGHMVELPDEIADAFVAAKLAVFLDGSSAIEAGKLAKERAEAHAVAEQKRRAEQMMHLHDNLPKEVRELAAEHGDDVVEDFLAEQVRLAQVHASPRALDAAIEGDDIDPPKRRRGRPRKDGT